MTDTAAPRPFFHAYDIRVRPLPVIAALIATPVLMQAILIAGRETARYLWSHGPADWGDRPWIFVALAIALQAVLGVIAILIAKRILPKLEPNLRWPPGKTYIVPAIFIGLAMGLIMLVADYWPQLLARTPITDYPANPIDSSGWLFAMAITGLAEETIFRGLIVGLLVLAIPGRLRIGALDLPIAAYVAAVLFGAAHYDSFLYNPLHLAIAQQIYAFAFGLTYVWLMERTRSLLAPMIAHGLGDATEVGATMLTQVIW